MTLPSLCRTRVRRLRACERALRIPGAVSSLPRTPAAVWMRLGLLMSSEMSIRGCGSYECIFFLGARASLLRGGGAGCQPVRERSCSSCHNDADNPRAARGAGRQACSRTAEPPLATSVRTERSSPLSNSSGGTLISLAGLRPGNCG